MPRPEPVCVYLCVPPFDGTGRRASRARFGAPHLSFGRYFLLLSSPRSKLGLHFSPFLFCFSLPPRSSRPRCLQLFVLLVPRCPWPGRSTFLSARSPPRVRPPPPRFSFPPMPCTYVVSGSGVLLLPAPATLGLGVVPLPAPPLFLFLWLPPPPRCVCTALCCLALPCYVLRVLLWLPVLCCCPQLHVVRCSLGQLFVCCAVLCPAVDCCCALYRVFGRVGPLPCSLCGLLSRLGVRCRVMCCVPGCCAAPRCYALCCAVVRWVVLSGSVWCHCLLCCALGRCLSPWGVVPCPASFHRVSLPCVLCAVCILPVVCWCVLFLAAVLCAVCALGYGAACSLSSPRCAVLCCAVLVPLRRAVRLVCAVLGAWCRGALLCAAPIALVLCGAV